MRVDCQGPLIGSFTGLPATGSTATCDMRYSYATDTTYSINFEGNTASLPSTVPVTVTASNTLKKAGFLRGSRDASNGVTIFNGPGTALTMGNGAIVLDTSPQNTAIVSNDKERVQGTVTFEASGAPTLATTVTWSAH